jgi:hypothetical protein
LHFGGGFFTSLALTLFETRLAGFLEVNGSLGFEFGDAALELRELA